LAVEGGILVARLRSQPVEGKANAELIEILSDLLGIPKSHIQIESGQSSRQKRIFCQIGAEIAAKRIDEKISNN
jgi:hypothetical protein